MNKFIEIAVGLVLLIIPIYLWIVNLAGMGTAAALVFKGAVMWILILAGLVLLIIGIHDLK